MKKLILPLTVLMMMLIPIKSNAQLLKKGTVFIESYYGLLAVDNFGAKLRYFSTQHNIYGHDYDRHTYTHFGPVGIRGEYCLSSKIGIGLDFSVATVSDYHSEKKYFDNNIVKDGFITILPQTEVTYNYTEKTNRTGGLLFVNYHVLESDKVDLFWMLGIGYQNYTNTLTENDGLPINQPHEKTLFITSWGASPFAYRLGIGFRFMVTNRVGINLQAGTGFGQLINSGISFKMK